MLREDNNGFVIFPNRNSSVVDRFESGKTLVYLVAFDIEDINGGRYSLSNNTLDISGDFISDDITKIEEDINFPDDLYLTSSICIGWSQYSFKLKNGGKWVVNFNSLTNEGKKLYYSMRKLHNNKELRILTFNSVV